MAPVKTDTDISKRKHDHINICLHEDVQFRAKGTLLDNVRLLHEALPELRVDAVDTRVTLFGKTLQAPLYISGMTGGTPEAEAINRDLALVAGEMGIAFGLGSQRPLLLDSSTLPSYRVRDCAPNALIFGNLGLVQASQVETARIREIIRMTEVDALCLHLNPAQEMMQADGDRDFTGGLETLKRLRGELDIPLIVKETGCGLSPRTLEKIRSAGIETVDVAGAGGTSWVAVETRRAAPERQPLGARMWDWGIPTAASIHYATQVEGLTILASGGIRSGSDAVNALALGATACGMAQPYLKARDEDGCDGVRRVIEQLMDQVRMSMVLTGSRTISELQQAPRVLVGELETWVHPSAHSGR
jgi:isopentenyl-diphosphate Delta-isomerase